MYCKVTDWWWEDNFGNCEKIEHRSKNNQKENWKYWKDENKKKKTGFKNITKEIWEK